MAKFNGYLGSITPTVGANNFNWNLGGVNTVRATIQEVVFGGNASSSTPMETKVARTSTAGTTPPAAGSVQRIDQTLTSAGNSLSFLGSASWATGPTVVSGALFGCNWNAYGGVVRWLAAPGEEFDIALTANWVVCVAVSGTGGSSYSTVWSEF